MFLCVFAARTSKATSASISLDERDNVLLLAGRFFVENFRPLGKFAIYDTVLGCEADVGTEAEHKVAAFKRILENVCTIRKGKRDVRGNIMAGSRDICKPELLQHLRRIIRVAVADGGPPEQRALFDLSPLESADAYLPNLRHIFRDRAHRMRSVQKGAWESLNVICNGFLDSFFTGNQSFSRMVQSSRKHLFGVSSKPCFPWCVVFRLELFFLSTHCSFSVFLYISPESPLKISRFQCSSLADSRRGMRVKYFSPTQLAQGIHCFSNELNGSTSC